MGSVIQNVNPLTYPAGEVLVAADVGRAGVLNASAQVVKAGAGVLPQLIIRDIADAIGVGVPCHHVASAARLSVKLGATVLGGDALTTDGNGDFIDGTSADATCLVAEIGGAVGESITVLRAPASVIA